MIFLPVPKVFFYFWVECTACESLTDRLFDSHCSALTDTCHVAQFATVEQKKQQPWSVSPPAMFKLSPDYKLCNVYGKTSGKKHARTQRDNIRVRTIPFSLISM